MIKAKIGLVIVIMASAFTMGAVAMGLVLQYRNRPLPPVPEGWEIVTDGERFAYRQIGWKEVLPIRSHTTARAAIEAVVGLVWRLEHEDDDRDAIRASIRGEGWKVISRNPAITNTFGSWEEFAGGKVIHYIEIKEGIWQCPVHAEQRTDTMEFCRECWNEAEIVGKPATVIPSW
jgi:hypothetical protein